MNRMLGFVMSRAPGTFFWEENYITIGLTDCTHLTNFMLV